MVKDLAPLYLDPGYSNQKQVNDHHNKLAAQLYASIAYAGISLALPRSQIPRSQEENFAQLIMMHDTLEQSEALDADTQAIRTHLKVQKGWKAITDKLLDIDLNE